MTKYHVTLPVTGYCLVEVEADDESSAIDKAMDECGVEHLETWQTHRQIVRGNVCSAEVNEAYAEPVE